MRLAFLADIHGNLPALEAVIADLKIQAPDAVYLMGDQINRCPWTNEVLDRLSDLAWPAIFGNHEYIISRIGTPDNFHPFTDPQRYPTLWWTHAQLTSANLQAMRQLPAERTLTFPSLPALYMTHGSPGNWYRGFLPEDSEAKINQMLHDVQADIILSAHTHHPLERIVPKAQEPLSGLNSASTAPSAYWHILNPGSVGLPYNGDVRAQYLLLDGESKGKWHPLFRQVNYDLDRLIHGFQTSSMRQVVGSEVELHLRTALTGLPWSSDFSFWLLHQPAELQRNLDAALPVYLATHGPGNWAFA